jgi:peptidoglycan hydrolase-like protein with peptidoglycan-binding domain
VHVYDDRCKRAIRAFQRDYRLRVDAIPGPQTQARLVQVCGY